ncbi:MAG: ABC transporter ATP-binding protein [Bdellovibrionota bacterium]
MQALSIESLVKTYQTHSSSPVDALKGITFDVRPGEIFGLLGPNGAGKTTLISIITTLEKPTSGDVRVFGQSVTQNAKATKTQIGVVPQEVVSSGFFNLEEILKYHSGYYGIKENSARIQHLLQRLKLTEHKHKLMRQLSGGMKRRMMIAKALVHSPKILLLDEPTAGVDVELRTQLWAFVRELQKEGVSIVLTTHYLQEAEALCDRVGIINKGELKYVGDTKEIIAQLTQKKVELITQDGRKVNFLLNKDESLGKALREKGISLDEVHNLITTEGTLEEAFVKVLST